MMAKKSADWISATLPAPPISKTNLPAGFSAEKIATSVAWRVVGERRIQWRAAFETLGDGGIVSGKIKKRPSNPPEKRTRTRCDCDTLLCHKRNKIRRGSCMNDSHFVPLPINSFSILLEVSAVDHLEANLLTSIVLSCGSNERRRGVNAIDFSDRRGEIGRELAITTANVEDAVSGLWVEVL